MPDPLISALAGVVVMLTATVAGFLRAMRTGALMTRKSHEEVVEVYAHTLDKSEAAYDRVVEQRDRLLRLTDVTVAVVEAIPHAKDAV